MTYRLGTCLKIRHRWGLGTLWALIVLTASPLAAQVQATQQAPPGELTQVLVAEVAAEMVPVSAGTFRMGECFCLVDRSARDLTLRAFRIAAYDVTFDQFDLFAKNTGRYPPDDHTWGRGKRPVIDVSWDDAQDFIVWLNQQSHRRYRLPSEAEWEYATRAGTTTKNYWGHAPDARFANDNPDSTLPVGSYPPNSWGLYDTMGNVVQWTQDCWNKVDWWTDKFIGAPTDGSAWETGDCSIRVTRGGPLIVNHTLIGISGARNGRWASDRNRFVGFRLAEDP